MPVRSALMTVMVRAADKAARGLKRDFGEVENLQVSKKGPADFVSTADLKASRPKAGASRAKARVDVLAKHPEVAEVITGFAASPSTAPATPEAPAAAEAAASRGGQAA